MSHCVLFAILCFFFGVSDCRQGWKTDGNGYLIYSANTNFSSTGELKVTGTFATKPNSAIKNVVLAFEDSYGNVTAQFMIDRGSLTVIASQSGLMQYSSISFKLNPGYAFDFTCSLKQEAESNGTVRHSLTVMVQGFIPYGIHVIDSVTWDMDNTKIYIGGYQTSIKQGEFFQGCLSNFVFQGTDMIGTYFSQYPNNTNPVRSAITVGSFSHVAEQCNDVMRPTPATSAPTTKAPATTPNGCIKNTLGIGIILANLIIAFGYLV